MESIVLMDYERIFALGILQTFYLEGGQLHWGKLDRAFKFLVINGLLVIGPIGDHSELYAVYNTWSEPLALDEDKIRAIAREQWERSNDTVTGAGMISIDGRITGWKSECFRIETPLYMRESIEQEVSRLFQAGALTPR